MILRNHKKTVAIVAGIVLPVFLLVGVTYANPSNHENEHNPFMKVWIAIQDLKNQIAAIPAGPQGPKGDTGATGAPGPQGPQGLPGLDGSSSPQKVFTNTQYPSGANESLLSGESRTWAWAAPEGSFLAFAKVNYSLDTSALHPGTITCNLRLEGDPTSYDNASDGQPYSYFGTEISEVSHPGSLVLTAALRSLNAGRQIQVVCTGSGASISALKLQLTPISDEYPLTPVLP